MDDVKGLQLADLSTANDVTASRALGSRGHTTPAPNWGTRDRGTAIFPRYRSDFSSRLSENAAHSRICRALSAAFRGFGNTAYRVVHSYSLEMIPHPRGFCRNSIAEARNA